MTNPFEDNAPATDNSGVTVSFKPHAGYNSPMVVVKGGSAEVVASILDDEATVGRLIDLVAKVDKQMQEKAGGGITPPKPSGSPGSGRPASATQHPEGKKMYCEHNGEQVERIYKTGVTKSGKNIGKPWAGFDCPRNDPNHPRIWDN